MLDGFGRKIPCKRLTHDRRFRWLAQAVVLVYVLVLVTDNVLSWFVRKARIEEANANGPFASVFIPSDSNNCGLPTWAQVVTTSTFPRFQIAVYQQDFKGSGSIVSQHLREYGGWEPQLWPTITDHVQPGSLFIDIGANIGFFSLFAASLGGHVVAFEPSWVNAQMLAVSACLNGLSDKITLYNIALSGTPQTSSKQSLIHGHSHDYLTRSERSESTGLAFELRFDRLDRYLPAERATLLKIDIEGFEQLAIESGLAGFRRYGAPLHIVSECDTGFEHVIPGAPGEPGMQLSTLFWKSFAREFGCAVSSSDLWYVGDMPWARWRLSAWVLLKRCGGCSVLLDCSGWLFSDYLVLGGVICCSIFLAKNSPHAKLVRVKNVPVWAVAFGALFCVWMYILN